MRQIASIELKADEPGLLALSQRLGVPPVFYSADALSALTGDFSDSAFVRETTGVGCVCERSAVLAALPGALIVPKTAVGPVTVAVAQSDFTVSFER
ncbi:MAG: cobalamin biosynthesis protein [Oscillospiraceae bacterium]